MPGSVARMTPQENVSAFLDPILGDLLDDVAFADLADEVVARLDALAESVGATS